MATEIVMPRLSDSMEEGTVLRWLVSEGDEVRPGQALVEVETDKATVTHEADSAGVILALNVSEGAVVPVGAPIAVLGAAGEELPAGAVALPGGSADGGGAVVSGSGEQVPSGSGGRPPLRAVGGGEPSGAEPSHGPGTAEVGRPKASPLARRLAAEAGIELSGLSGSGPHGRVTRGDVERALAGGSPSHDGGEAGADSAVAAAHEAAVAATAAGAVAAPAESLAGEAAESLSSAPAEAPPEAAAPRTAAKGATTVQEPSRLQQTVARRMAESRATVPDLELRREVDMSQVVALREQLREVSDPLPSINDFIVKAVALALREFPRVNGAYRDARFESYARVNVGIAVAARDALVVPTIFDADRKRLSEIAEASRTLAGRVRDGSVAPAELAGGTFTVSNLGMYGIDSFSAVINPPQAAILAVGAMRPRPVVDESGAVVARPTVMFTLACDHRILYGADGAQFLARVCELLGRPIALLAN